MLPDGVQKQHKPSFFPVQMWYNGPTNAICYRRERAMKLAEALQERADLNRSIAQLKSRLEASALVQQGSSP